MKKFVPFLLLLTIGSQPALAQHEHARSAEYEYPSDPLVREKLDRWQDRKFGMIIHWGLYAVPGIVESWSICAEEADWIPRDSTITYDAYKRQYWDLAKVFNPVKFAPDQWADAAGSAGMNYLVFTTKHHDGFCMFDTAQTDFSIAKGPFADDPRADVAKHVFEAFRKKDFMIGAYFSKPDWHSQYYWWDRYATPTRNVNYDITRNRWRWEQFKEFTHRQIGELMTGYGAIDILWLDGGWVGPRPGTPARDQDIDMPRLAAMARTHQPGLLVVDRTIHGPYENYQTPEQTIPAEQLPFPWETCMTLGVDWGYVKGQRLKPASRIVHSLIEIVAKGGSLLLGVGPDPEGLLPEDIVERLEEIGRWTAVNGKAIYGTRITERYNDGDTWFTQSKDGRTLYAINCVDPVSPPEKIEWTGNEPKKGSRIVLLQTGKPVRCRTEGGKTVVDVPRGLPAGLPALAFEIQTK